MKKPIVVITGLNSLLGNYLAISLRSQYTLFGLIHKTPLDSRIPLATDHVTRVDISQKKSITHILKHIKPQFVIHLAALSNIDYCQSHKKIAYKINVEGTRHICEALNGTSTQLIFISSNAVFAGTHPPYHENDITRPLNVYGQTKLEAEKVVKSAKLLTTIIRSTTMFGWHPVGSRENDLTYYLAKLRSLSPIFLVNDRFFNPLSATTAITAIQRVIEKKHTGVFHIAGHNRISRYTFVNTLISAFALKTHAPIHAVSNAYFANHAPRPLDATLSIEKMKNILSIHPPTLLDDLQSLKKTEPPTARYYA
ncbi:MAG: SDR family oxidoreductase [Patescibacteria group bacterium]